MILWEEIRNWSLLGGNGLNKDKANIECAQLTFLGLSSEAQPPCEDPPHKQ